jgi:predicted thioredoxin/glutaredoxin
MAHQVILYSKPGCHLCELAREMVLGLRREYDFHLVETDITLDPALFKQYWDKIPVVVIDGRTTLAEPIDIADVRAALDGQV